MGFLHGFSKSTFSYLNCKNLKTSLQDMVVANLCPPIFITYEGYDCIFHIQ